MFYCLKPLIQFGSLTPSVVWRPSPSFGLIIKCSGISRVMECLIQQLFLVLWVLSYCVYTNPTMSNGQFNLVTLIQQFKTLQIALAKSVLTECDLPWGHLKRLVLSLETL